MTRQGSTANKRVGRVGRSLCGELRSANILASINQEGIRTGSVVPSAGERTLAGRGAVRLTEVWEEKERAVNAFAEVEEGGQQVRLGTRADERRAPGGGVNCSTSRPISRATRYTLQFPPPVQAADGAAARRGYLHLCGMARGVDGRSVCLDRRELQCATAVPRPAVRGSGGPRDAGRVWGNSDTGLPNRVVGSSKQTVDGGGGPGDSCGSAPRGTPRPPAAHRVPRSVGDLDPRKEPVRDKDLAGVRAGDVPAPSQVVGQQWNSDCRPPLQADFCRCLGARELPWRPDPVRLRDTQQGAARAEPYRPAAREADDEHAGLPQADATALRASEMPEEAGVCTPRAVAEET